MYSYAGLVADIDSFTNVSADSALIDTCIRLAEQDIYHGVGQFEPLRINVQRREWLFTVGSGTGYAHGVNAKAVDAGITTVSVKALGLDTRILSITALRRNGVDQHRCSIRRARAGKHKDVWAIQGTDIVLYPPTSEGEELVLDVYQRYPSITEPSNPLPDTLTQAYSAYLYGASGHLLKHHEDPRGEQWIAEAMAIVAGLNANDAAGLS